MRAVIRESVSRSPRPVNPAIPHMVDAGFEIETSRNVNETASWSQLSIAVIIGFPREPTPSNRAGKQSNTSATGISLAHLPCEIPVTPAFFRNEIAEKGSHSSAET
jgi:hypothetical protein